VSAPTTPLVLYADDERSNRIVFEQSLRGDFDVITVADGAEALAILGARDVAVLVTDMRMPMMTGEELLRIVKERHPRTIRMVVTAYSDVDPILRAINEGLVSRYLLKPWSHTELVQVLRWGCEAWAFGKDSAALHQRLIETERLAMLGHMASSLVHDLKTPLMSILGNAEHVGELASAAGVLREGIATVALDPEYRRHLQTLIDDIGPATGDIKSAAWLLDELLNRLRELGRPNSERGARPSPIDPLPIVRHAMAVCQPLALNVRASIGYEGPGELPRVRMSPTELTQVLINVVTNGAQAVAALGTPNGRVRIVAHERDGMLELQVRDNGIGIPAEVLRRIGTPFFTTRAEGTGLGIANCQRLIGTAGGRFVIDSEPGKGTIVTIVLPTAAA